ncbi:MAG: hypothetical protein Q4F97_08740 [Bacteroidales bacterium]|nr:hypothetical protein [Bacteroidales bacterium]
MKRFYAYLVLVLLAFACDDTSESVIPSYRVYLELNLNIYTSLKTQGGYELITKRPNESSYIGYGGVLVVCTYDGNYYAYDLACPYDKNPGIKLNINSEMKAVCNKCGSEFNGIFWGNKAPTAGPALKGALTLRNYTVFISNDKIQIIN